jgi:hypothetical protein
VIQLGTVTSHGYVSGGNPAMPPITLNGGSNGSYFTFNGIAGLGTIYCPPNDTLTVDFGRSHGPTTTCSPTSPPSTNNSNAWTTAEHTNTFLELADKTAQGLEFLLKLSSRFGDGG